MKILRHIAITLALMSAPALAQVQPGTSPLTGPKGGTNNAFMQFTGPTTSLKTFTIPNANSTLAALGTIQTWTGAQSFSDGTLILLGSGSGSSTLKAPATGGGTATLFGGSDTIAGLAAAQVLTNKTLNCANNTCTVRIGTDVSGLGTNVATVLANSTNGANGVVVPTAAGTNGQLLIGQTGLAGAWTTIGSDGNLSNTGSLIVTKTNGTSFTSYATAAIGQLPGITTNAAASSGNIGEYVSSTVVSGSAISLSNGVSANLTSISLTAGEWAVEALGYFSPGVTTNTQFEQMSLSTTSATANTTPGFFNQAAFANVVNPNSQANTVGTIAVRFNLSTTTTIFAVAQSGFTVSTMTVYGILQARRVH